MAESGGRRSTANFVSTEQGRQHVTAHAAVAPGLLEVCTIGVGVLELARKQTILRYELRLTYS